MNTDAPQAGWLKLAMLWIGTFLGNVFTATNLQIIASVAVIILTGLQILVTWRRLKKPVLPAEESNTL